MNKFGVGLMMGMGIPIMFCFMACAGVPAELSWWMGVFLCVGVALIPKFMDDAAGILGMIVTSIPTIWLYDSVRLIFEFTTQTPID